MKWFSGRRTIKGEDGVNILNILIAEYIRSIYVAVSIFNNIKEEKALYQLKSIFTIKQMNTYH